MSKVKIQGNASGTGVLTIAAPNTSTDRTITLPDSTGTILDNTSTLDATKLSGNLPALNAASLTNVPKDVTVGGRKNMIINGAMQVSQRGNYTSATAISDATYYLDRWELDIATVTGTVQNVSNGYLSKLNTQKIVATSTATGRLVSIQKIEVSGGMLGVELTASAQVKSNSTDARLFLVDSTNGTVLDVVAHTGGGSFEKLSVSGTAPTSCTDLRVYLALRSSAQGNVAITSGDYFEFTNVQLELGSTATDFEYRSYGEELALCQRYYERFIADASAEMLIGVGVNASATDVFINYPYKQIKRVIPSFSSSGASHFERLTASWGAGSSISCQANIATARLNMGGFPSSTIWNATEVRITAAANNAHWFAFDAEL